MRSLGLVAILAAAVVAGAAAAQTPAPKTPAPAPYAEIAVTLPKPLTDPNFVAFRKRLAAIAEKKDRAALARLVAAQGFFWDRSNGEAADKKSGGDGLAAALGLGRADGSGWDMLASFAEEPTAAPDPDHASAFCAPAGPSFDAKAFKALLKATNTDAGEWGYPLSDSVEVHSAPHANAPVTGKLALAFVHVAPQASTNVSSYLRVVTSAGKVGYVAVDSIAPIGNERICYRNDNGVWKITGYIGGGKAQ